MDDLLIIFIKNPILGKVKTRLAKDVGDEKALEVYKRLLQWTHQQTQNGPYSKWLYYSDEVVVEDIWQAGYEKKVQHGNDLGERMLNAFQEGFQSHHKRICIIGSDCIELDAGLINKAFQALREKDYVIGPAHDGGYYLLGMNTLNPSVFRGKEWSTDQVYPQTLADIQSQEKTVEVLQTLSDIDTIEDLRKFKDLLS